MNNKHISVFAVTSLLAMIFGIILDVDNLLLFGVCVGGVASILASFIYR